MGRDTTPSNFFPWGRLKEQVYFSKPTTLEEFDRRIRKVMSSIPQEFLVKSVYAVYRRLQNAVYRRLQNLVANAGTHKL